MTPRQCFRRVMAFQPVDRLPVLSLEPYEPRALDRWRREGLPADTDPTVFLGMSRLARALHREFGPELRLAGNVPKEAVVAGPAAIDHEIERLMPLIREGGFIPALDDMGPADIPFTHYRYMIERLHEIRLDDDFRSPLPRLADEENLMRAAALRRAREVSVTPPAELRIEQDEPR